MNGPCAHRSPVSRCNALVPSELDSVCLCVLHLTVRIEQNCTDLHRQIALRGATLERRSEVAAYIEECALLLARIATNLTLSDELKRRMLSTFLSLMNLRDKIEPKSYPEPRVARSAIVQTRSAAAGYEGHVTKGESLLSVHCSSQDQVKQAKKIMRDTGAEGVAPAGEISTEHTQDLRSPAEESAMDDEPRQEHSPGLPEAYPELPLTEEIRDRAHAIYLERGAAQGDDLEDWLKAERELKEHQRRILQNVNSR